MLIAIPVFIISHFAQLVVDGVYALLGFLSCLCGVGLHLWGEAGGQRDEEILILLLGAVGGDGLALQHGLLPRFHFAESGGLLVGMEAIAATGDDVVAVGVFHLVKEDGEDDVLLPLVERVLTLDVCLAVVVLAGKLHGFTQCARLDGGGTLHELGGHELLVLLTGLCIAAVLHDAEVAYLHTVAVGEVAEVDALHHFAFLQQLVVVAVEG